MKKLTNIKKYLEKEMSILNPLYQNDTLDNILGFLILAIEKNQELKNIVKDNYLLNASEIFIKMIAKRTDQFILDEVLFYSHNHIEALGYKTNYLELIAKKKEVDRINKRRNLWEKRK